MPQARGNRSGGANRRTQRTPPGNAVANPGFSPRALEEAAPYAAANIDAVEYSASTTAGTNANGMYSAPADGAASYVASRGESSTDGTLHTAPQRVLVHACVHAF